MISTLGNKPALVIDTNFIRSLAANAHRLSPDYAYVLPDIVVKELCTTTTSQRDGMAAKLADFVAMNSDNLFFAMYWQDISQLESHPNYETFREGAIDWEGTRLVRTTTPLTGEDAIAQLKVMEPVLGEHDSKTDEFFAFISSRSAYIKKVYPELLTRYNHSTPDYIRRPDAIGELLQCVPTERFASQDWQAALNTFPDVHAIGRWLRIIEFYSYKYAANGGLPDCNDYEDANIAITASYFDGLLTGDKDLSNLTRCLFHSVQVVPSPLEFDHAITNRPELQI